MFERTYPWAPLAQLRREMDRLFDDTGGGFMRPRFRTRAAYPALNVWDTGECLCVEAEIPGVAKGDLEIYSVGNELTLKGHRQPMAGEKVTYHRHERGTGEFTRVVTLPCEINADMIDAALNDGVLLLQLPKTEREKPKRITVKTR